MPTNQRTNKPMQLELFYHEFVQNRNLQLVFRTYGKKKNFESTRLIHAIKKKKQSGYEFKLLFMRLHLLSRIGASKALKVKGNYQGKNKLEHRVSSEKHTDPGMKSRRFPPIFMLRIPSSSPLITCSTQLEFKVSINIHLSKQSRSSF
jgi:hypothetical protein